MHTPLSDASDVHLTLQFVCAVHFVSGFGSGGGCSMIVTSVIVIHIHHFHRLTRFLVVASIFPSLYANSNSSSLNLSLT